MKVENAADHLDPSWEAEEIGVSESGETVFEGPKVGRFIIGAHGEHGDKIGREPYAGKVKKAAKDKE